MLAVVLLSRGGYGHAPREYLANLVSAISAQLEAAHQVVGAYVDNGSESLPSALQTCADAGATHIAVLPVFAPHDENLHRWLAKVMVRWHSSWSGQPLQLQLLPSLTASAMLGEAAVGMIQQQIDTATNLVELPPKGWEHDPQGWSRLPPHRYHLLMCHGPRCTASGAGEVWQHLRQRLREEKLLERENGALVASTGCLFPCNHAPVLVVHPYNVWYSVPTIAAAEAILEQHLRHGTPAADHVMQS